MASTSTSQRAAARAMLQAPVLQVKEDNKAFAEIEKTTHQRLAELHAAVQVPNFRAPSEHDSCSVQIVEQLRERFQLGRYYSRIFLNDYFLPNLASNRGAHGFFDSEGGPLTREDLFTTLAGFSRLDRFAWCTHYMKESTEIAIDTAKDHYEWALKLIQDGVSIEVIRQILPELRPLGRMVSEEDIFNFSRACQAMRESDLVQYLHVEKSSEVTIFDTVLAGPHTLRNIAVGYLAILQLSFEKQIKRPISLYEWDVLSHDLLRSIKDLSSTHTSLVQFFRGNKNAPSDRHKGMPHMTLDEDDLIIGQRNGLLKVEIGPRPFKAAEEAVQARKQQGYKLDLRPGCAGSFIIPPVYRWIRGVIRDCVVVPELEGRL